VFINFCAAIYLSLCASDAFCVAELDRLLALHKRSFAIGYTESCGRSLETIAPVTQSSSTSPCAVVFVFQTTAHGDLPLL